MKYILLRDVRSGARREAYTEDVENGVQQNLNDLGILHHQQVTDWLQSLGLQNIDHLQRKGKEEWKRETEGVMADGKNGGGSD